MAITAQAGILGFGPQTGMGAAASTIYRHKASDIDLAVIDDVRLGPPEVGGVPVPSIPYKAGYVVSGGATMMPRLADTFGWLLYGAMGNASAAENFADKTAIMGQVTLSTTADTTVNRGLTPPPARSLLTAYIDSAPGSEYTITVSGRCSATVDGTYAAGTDTIVIGAAETSHASTKYFETVTQVSLPLLAGGKKVSLGVAEAGLAGTTFNFGTNAVLDKWLTFTKYIPNSVNDQRMLETYTDCKVVNLTFTLPNDGLITSRVDIVGREYNFTMNSDGTYAGEFEDYQSIPIGCTVGGYFRVPSFSNESFPIVSATVGIQNAPLDLRMERVYGSPYLEDVTVIGRALTMDIVLKWKDPSLYRAILTGSTKGTTWNTMPFVQDLKVVALAPSGPTGAVNPYRLAITSDAVMWQMNGGIRLAGNQAVMMRFTGTAIDTSGNYASMELVNDKTYTWPTV
jgi:hypothetical protein